MGSYTENFTYDAADRLTNWTINNTDYTADYSGNGNIVRKSDFGLYAYGSSKPHAVSGISSLIAGTGTERTCEAEYNTIGKVSKLTLKNGNTTLKTATFTYAADGQRRKMQIGNATTIYVDDYQVNKNGNTEQRLHYISGPAGLCALIVQNYNGSTLTSRAIYYLQTDYQGSIIAAYNSNGTLYKRFAYDPWGRRRNGSNWTNYQTETETLITCGYCGHEHLDDFGTINMNGRIYDPRLGRFLSPDPYVQAPYNSQNYNRYSYCWNNPLKYTDPDGEWIHIVIGALVGGIVNWAAHGCDFTWDGLGYFGVGALAGAATAATGGATTGFFASGTGAAVVAMGTGAVSSAGNGIIQNGFDWNAMAKNAAIGAFSGLATYGMGQISSELGIADKLLNTTNIKNTIARNIIGSSVDGAIIGGGSGFLSGIADCALNGNWDNLWENTKMGFLTGLGGGALYGGIKEIGYQLQLKNGYKKSLNSNSVEAVANGGPQFTGELGGGDGIIEANCFGSSIDVIYDTSTGTTRVILNIQSTPSMPGMIMPVPGTPRINMPGIPSNNVLKLIR